MQVKDGENEIEDFLDLEIFTREKSNTFKHKSPLGTIFWFIDVCNARRRCNWIFLMFLRRKTKRKFLEKKQQENCAEKLFSFSSTKVSGSV